MENASKALLIAGGILIAILVISLFAILFNNLRDYENSQEDARNQEEVVRYNNPYTAYDRDGITLNEIKSLYNMIESNNKKAENGDTNYYKIKSNIKALCNKPDADDEKIDWKDPHPGNCRGGCGDGCGCGIHRGSGAADRCRPGPGNCPGRHWRRRDRFSGERPGGAVE